MLSKLMESKLKPIDLLILWIVFYLYSVFVGFLVQFFVLPILFPSAHWKDGLMVGGDWILFHTEAVELAKKIASEGWSTWTLRPAPNYQAMSGITAFFYALTGIHKPWVILFYNAFLHASAGVILFYLLTLFEVSKKYALIFSTLFVVFPTSLTWVSQIHKDGLYILGAYSNFLAIALAFSQKTFHNLLAVFFGILSGLSFFIVGREYAVKIFFYFHGFTVLAVFAIIIFQLIRKNKEKTLQYLKTLSVVFLIFLFFDFLQPPQPQPPPPPQQQQQQPQQPQQPQPQQPPPQQQQQPQQPQQPQPQQPPPQQQPPQQQWIWSPYIPDKVEYLFYQLAYWRNEVWTKHLAGRPGGIDEDVRFYSVWDFIEYTPRAFIIGLFSPFPSFWFTKGSTTGGTIARYITPFEAVYLYVAWILLPFAIWKHREKPWLWIILLISFSFIWFHTIAEPNVGPIVRKRYGYVMFLSALSYSVFLAEVFKRWKRS